MIENFLWELNQTARVNSASMQASAASGTARDANQATVDLTEQLDKLTLITMAIWELMHEKTGLTEQELMHRVKEIDLRDGKADGKVTREVSRCSKCDRVMSPRHTRCLYCGEEKLIHTAFDEIT